MKKKCILFGNCQLSGVSIFLKKYSNFYDIYDIEQYANWQLILDNQHISIKSLQEADLVIYQPLTDVHNCYSTNKHNPKSFFNLLKESCKTISFPRIHNNAIFPIFKRYFHGNEMYGNIVNNYDNDNDNDINKLIELYDKDLINFDFDERMSENYKISKLKEENCDVKIIDFIFENIQNHKLFLTHDHPTSFIFNEVTRQICNLLNIDYDYENGLTAEENITGLPDSLYQNKTCQYPISRYAIKHFNFKYIQNEDPDADQFYKNNIIVYKNK
jgi:hypothetical protein